MSIIEKYPLIRFVIIFSFGILLQKTFLLDYNLLIPIAMVAMLGSLCSLFVCKQILKIFFPILILSSGAIALKSATPNAAYPFEKEQMKNAILFGRVINRDLPEKDKERFVLMTDSLFYDNAMFIGNIRVQCVLMRDEKEHLSALSIGNRVLLRGTLARPRNRRNPYEFDYEKFLLGNSIPAVLSVKGVHESIILDNDTDFFPDLVYRAREGLLKQIKSLYPDEVAGLIRGLLLADRREIEYTTKESFINAGVVHVLAVSGLHVGFITLIFIFLFGRMNVYAKYIFTIIGLSLFVLITGAPPSVVRASTMAIALILGYLSNRSYEPLNALALAAFVLLLYDASELFNPGFQLSFSAVISILIYYPKLSQVINGWMLSSEILRKLLLFIAVSLSAQIGTLPFTLLYFHKLSVVALFTNLIVIPAIGIIVSLAILSLVVSIFSYWVALVFAASNRFIARAMFGFIDYTASFEYSHLFINDFSLVDSIIFYFGLAILTLGLSRFSGLPKKLFFASLIIANIFLCLSFGKDSNPIEQGKLNIMMIDVGQGDSFLLVFPNGKTALIDAGNATPFFDNGERIIAPLLKNLGIDKVNYGFVTHVDADHYKGFEYLIKKGMIEKIYKPVLIPSLKRDTKFEDLIRSNNTEITYYHKDTMAIGECRLYFLNDTTNTYYRAFDANNSSGIIKIEYGTTKFLFMGDAEIISERLYCRLYRGFLEADVLKIGHHGSETGTGNFFLNYVNPKIALVSAGKFNKFGHPAEAVIDRLNRNNIRIFRTDLQGAAILSSDGYSISEIDWRNY